MDRAVDVAIVGAGPYGLSLGAHLREAGVSMRQFGMPMQLWQTAMPRGMFLTSPGFASSLSSPDSSHTLAAFCKATGRRYAGYGLPVPLETFVAYGLWFAAELVPGVEETLVTGVSVARGCFELGLATGESARARRVVIATGAGHFAHVPGELASLPAAACTHSSAHADLSAFAGQRVIVVGAGQSALETAALLHEHGTDVRIVMRKRELVWNGPPLAPGRPLRQRMAEPESGLGSGWGTWLYARHPGLFWHLPAAVRVHRARTALGPAGASWLRPRVEGQVPVLSGQSLSWASAGASGVRLGLSGHDGRRRELRADHVIAATGYRAGLGGLSFLGDDLRAGVRTLAGAPAVGRDYQSSVPGLYFVGPAVAPAFGPVMRFVSGAGHAARTVAPRLISTAWWRSPATVGAGR